MICPICNRDVQIKPKTETACECCKSIIYQNDDLEARIIKPKMTFSSGNFLVGFISLIGFLAGVVYLNSIGMELFVVGLTLLIPTILVILQQHIWYKSVDLKSFDDLNKALITKRLQYYDLGSRFLIYTIIFILLAELVLLVLGMVF